MAELKPLTRSLIARAKTNPSKKTPGTRKQRGKMAGMLKHLRKLKGRNVAKIHAES